MKNRHTSEYRYARHLVGYWLLLTPSEPQSRFGDKLLGNGVVCPQNGTAVLKGLITGACIRYSYYVCVVHETNTRIVNIILDICFVRV